MAEANSYMTAKHILFKTTDDSGTALSDADKAAKKQQAEQVAAQLRAVTDPDKRVELFDQLMEQYNEDTGESSYPHGYCFTSGTMVTEFEDACKRSSPTRCPAWWRVSTATTSFCACRSRADDRS